MLFAARETPLFVLNGKEEREDANDRAASSGHPSTSVMRDEKGEDEEDPIHQREEKRLNRAKCFRRYRSIGRRKFTVLAYDEWEEYNRSREVGKRTGKEREGEQSEVKTIRTTFLLLVTTTRLREKVSFWRHLGTTTNYFVSLRVLERCRIMGKF